MLVFMQAAATHFFPSAALHERPPLLARPPGSDLRIMMWFSHFAMAGMSAFKYGAFALAHYALANREEVRGG